MQSLRALGAALLVVFILQLIGCTTTQVSTSRLDDRHCFKIGKSYRPTLICTVEVLPSAETVESAKRFEPNADSYTVYVLRTRWGDVRNHLVASVDGRAPVTTVPGSLVRLRLKPGEHVLAFEWEDKVKELHVVGGPGDLHFVEIVGSVWSWGSTYEWEHNKLVSLRNNATAATLISDIDLRQIP